MHKSRKVVADVTASPVSKPPPQPQAAQHEVPLCISCMKQKARLLGDPCDITDRPFFCCLACAAVYGINAIVNSHRRWCAVHKDWSCIGGQCEACNRETLKSLCPKCRTPLPAQADEKDGAA